VSTRTRSGLNLLMLGLALLGGALLSPARASGNQLISRGVNLDAECRGLYGPTAVSALEGGTVFDWHCHAGSASWSLDVEDACRRQYGDPNIHAEYQDATDPLSWICVDRRVSTDTPSPALSPPAALDCSSGSVTLAYDPSLNNGRSNILWQTQAPCQGAAWICINACNLNGSTTLRAVELPFDGGTIAECPGNYTFQLYWGPEAGRTDLGKLIASSSVSVDGASACAQ
jgi:hypothetical protein